MEIRFNPIHLNSIQAFANIHSRRGAAEKQVYFVRADGVGPSLLSDISYTDRAMSSDEHTAYQRLIKLATLSDPADINSYLQKFSELRKGSNDIFPQHPDISPEIADVVRSLLDKLRNENSDMTETAERNIAVQLLYRIDHHLIDLLKQRSSKFCKLIYSGCSKTSEYLFGYAAAMLGIDTLILMPEGKGSIPDFLLKDCVEIPCGQHSRLDFPEYRPVKIDVQSQSPQIYTEQKVIPAVNLRIPEHPKRKTSPDPVRLPTPSKPKNIPKERSYEELAALAESVVMIILEDEKGEPVASGSGIAIHTDGYILTNCHVISSGVSYCVRIENDDKIYREAELIKYNPVFDLALIRIQRKMPPLPVYDGRRKLRRGEKVFAIGSPMGLFNSVSDGIISGFRIIKDREMIQFTAPISHGSSGGALLNSCGEVIGICTGGIDEGQNLNLAVSYEHILSFASNVI